jgi:SAM-dependent methyltransferase
MTRPRAEAFPTIEKALEDPGIRALFSRRFMAAAEIYDELVDAACWEILERIRGIPSKEGMTGTDPAEAAGVPARARPALRYLVEKLVASGFLIRKEGGLARGKEAPSSVETLAAELVATEPSAAIGVEIVRVLVDEAPSFFDGGKTGEEILFTPNRLPLWIRYFSNDNILYAINNTLGAEILSRVLPSAAEVLEVGGGCGSAAEEALRRLGPRIARYRFTELVPTFARRGERAARAAASPRTAVESSKLDMTRPWREQGVEPGTFDAVYSVNCFHVAPDLQAVLHEAKAAVKPGGLVVVSECVRPSAHPGPSYVELIFNFLESFTNVKTNPATRPTHGFLTPQAWRRSFTAAGFSSVEIFPDVDAVAREYPGFFVGVVVARR